MKGNYNVAISAETSPRRYVAYSGEGYSMTYEEAQEAVKRANAYPEMLAVLARLAAALRANGAPNCEAMKERRALLEKLGEPS